MCVFATQRLCDSASLRNDQRPRCQTTQSKAEGIDDAVGHRHLRYINNQFVKDDAVGIDTRESHCRNNGEEEMTNCILGNSEGTCGTMQTRLISARLRSPSEILSRQPKPAGRGGDACATSGVPAITQITADE